jgi:hypothetical protein
MNTIDRNTLIRRYTSLRIDALNPAMLAFKEQIIEDLARLRALCDLEGITKEELDAAFEAQQRGQRK